jgi:ribosomal protein S18 acetylase RimI-like enzyme
LSKVTPTALTVADIPGLAALWQACGLTRPWNDPEDDARLALTGPSSTILGVRIDRALACAVMVGWDGHRGAVYYLAVAEGYRGKGLGRALMEAAETWLAQFNAPKLNLMVRTDNAAVHDFYDRLDYGRDEVRVRGKRLRP